MRVISETVDWESSNLINERNAEGEFVSGVEEDSPDSSRKQRDFLRSL
jgi:hypothetical protein